MVFKVGVQFSKAVESGGTFCCDGKKGGGGTMFFNLFPRCQKHNNSIGTVLENEQH